MFKRISFLTAIFAALSITATSDARAQTKADLVNACLESCTSGGAAPKTDAEIACYSDCISFSLYLAFDGEWSPNEIKNAIRAIKSRNPLGFFDDPAIAVD